MIRDKIAGSIKRLREKKNITQEELAKMVGVLSRVSIANLETSKQSLTVEMLVKLCGIFGCKYEDILPPVPNVKFKKEYKTKVITVKVKRTVKRVKLTNPKFTWHKPKRASLEKPAP